MEKILFRVIFNSIPGITRALIILYVYKKLGELGDDLALIEFGCALAYVSMANTLGLGGSYSLLVSYIKKNEFTQVHLKYVIYLSVISCLFCLIYTYTMNKLNENISIISALEISCIVAFICITNSIVLFYNSFLVGRGLYVNYFQYSIITSLSAIFLFYLMAPLNGYYLCILGLIFYPLFSTIFPLYKIIKSSLSIQSTIEKNNFEGIFTFIKKIFPTIYTAATFPLFIRGMLETPSVNSDGVSSNIAGALRLTDTLALFFGPYILNQVYPEYCGWKRSDNKIFILIKSYLFITLMALGCFLMIYIFSNEIFKYLFSQEIIIDNKLLGLLFIAEAFRISLSIFGLALIDANIIYLYIIVETITKVAIFIFSTPLYQSFGISGIIWAHFLTILFASIVCLLYVKYKSSCYD